MAASDKTYRNQKALDAVFGVSSVALLVSIIWMFAQDYYRPWKAEQRVFRDVEAGMFTRQALYDLPDPDKLQEVKKRLRAARADYDKNVDIHIIVRRDGDRRMTEKKSARRKEAIEQLAAEIARKQPDRERDEARVGDLKSLIASRSSFVNIAKEQRLFKEAAAYEKEVQGYQREADEAQAKLDVVVADIKFYQHQRDNLEQPLNQALAELKRLTDDLVRKTRAAVAKTWGFGDWFRSLPVIDAFASPTKIHQFTLNELTIDYNFKNVTRFDRCMTCHQGIDRPAFTKENLRKLREVPKDLTVKLKKTQDVLEELREELKGRPDELRNVPEPSSLRLTALSPGTLTDDRVNQFSAHPRLDLFVGANSKHPSEKFGCTICHSGQGSATDFYWASHTPNDPKQVHEWKDKHGWGAVHFWDFPMLPRRFVESSCLKCHHQVTDLITSYNKPEAPQLLHGYNLIRENGCFGCHEINGTRNGQPIGPDMRLEPYPAPELLPAADRVRILADKDNPPGTLRKVGPSLFRLAEKTNEEWTRRWIKSPRSFRPDTRMPHFYGLANNNAEALKGTGQEKFPDAEAASIAHFLFAESNHYLDLLQKVQATKDRDIAYYEKLIREKTAEIANRDEFRKLPFAKQNETVQAVEDAKASIAMLRFAVPPRVHPGKFKAPEGDALNRALVNGRRLFSERGCLACHNHDATTRELALDVKGEKQEGGKEAAVKKEKVPAVHSEAHFGPTLSQLAEKLVGKTGDKDKARTWLINWVQNPWLHSPRTKMPITHLTPQEAADVAEWLLSQPATELGEDWEKTQVATPDPETLKDLARVYLVRILSRSELNQFFTDKDVLDEGRLKDLPADEKALADRLRKAGSDAEKAKATMWYTGRKAVGRLGCFGCHDIRGFENAKPIGTALDGWGKKDPERLAFEDIHNYVRDHYTRVDEWDNPKKVEEGFKLQGKPSGPYQGFFWEALMHNTREGYLYQKIKEPRSYDYKRKPAWDDRSRMPQFKFAHPRPRKEESEEEYAQRKKWQEYLVKSQTSPTERQRWISLLGYDPTRKESPPRKAETPEQFRARQAREEAEAREAVMTFVLGLVGDAIPTQYLNAPSKDRSDEIKGRQVLDRFNCAGCHTVRPGSFEFQVTPAVRKALEESATEPPNDYFFPDHYVWEGRPPTSSALLAAHGVRPRLLASEDDEKVTAAVGVFLTEALNFRDPADRSNNGKGANGKPHNIRGSDMLRIMPADLVYPPAEALKSPEAFARAMKELGPYGGAFAELLGRYLYDKGVIDKAQGGTNPYATGTGEFNPDNGQALASVPPVLVNQGERTQPDWLFRFLRDPQRVRQLTVLRMPRFNLSEEEARALVKYFSAVDRLTNPNIGLDTPFEKLPQRGPLTDQYWRERTAAFVKRLDPKLLGALEEDLKPAWERMIRDRQKEAADAETTLKEAAAAVKGLEARLSAEKDENRKKTLAVVLEDAKARVSFWEAEARRLGPLSKGTTLEGLKREYRETEAYAQTGYRVVLGLCAKCHEAGTMQPDPAQLRGPSLNISHERLRPGWLKRWLAYPSRMVPYTSPMPQNFPNTGRKGDPHPESLEQVIMVRDTLLNYPQVEAMPINRNWLLSAGKEDKKK
jgi:mono/diheme cytochrome c family protein